MVKHFYIQQIFPIIIKRKLLLRRGDNVSQEKLTKEGNDSDGHLEILEKYDAESRFRVFNSKKITYLISFIAISFSLYHLYTAALGPPATLKHRSLHVAIVLL